MSTRRPMTSAVGVALGVLAALFLPGVAEAYVGPGAGFALLGSFLVLFATIVLAVVSILLWPFRALWRLIRRHRLSKPSVRRLVIVGFDGQEPRLTERMLDDGKLPNFARLAETGCYSRLRSTMPSVSPVAWSSFSTGTHPAKHNIFDFLGRDLKTYMPVLSSSYIGPVERFLKLGRFRVPLTKPEMRLMRKSRPFWSVLGKHGIWSQVLRVPITVPPEKFYGTQLSAMCVPDLLGTQGTFLYYSTRPPEGEFKEGGIRVPVEMNGDRIETQLSGPENMFLENSPPMQVPLAVDLDRGAGVARVAVDGELTELRPRELSDWIRVTFKAAPGVKVPGLFRMMVTEMDDHFGLYITPLNIDPEKPAMPVSHPGYYATYLAKRIGPYATLGLAEDTWGLNEGVVDDETFLKLTYDIDAEREAMFFAALKRLRRGVQVCVFDATDRIQHMFWRYREDGHPAAKVPPEKAEHADAVEELYRHNDALLGRILDELRDDDLLMVLSDHGFTSFRRGVNINAWLHANGYLALKDGTDGSAEWLRDVDWSRTRAYCLGLTGLFLNVRGREAEGIVAPGEERQALKRELIERLSGLRDEDNDAVGINEVFDTAEQYTGPYLHNGPDLLLGFNHGYRVSWDCATGMVSGPVFSDNEKAWSGDHCVDPRIVPGVFFCSRPIDTDDPALIDIAPTALELFGVSVPGYMDGSPLFKSDPSVRR